jgi:SAM-dependent methyltransferase
MSDMLNDRGDVIVVKKSDFIKEMIWRVYDHPKEFSCFISKRVDGRDIGIVRYDMACLDIESGGYGVVCKEDADDWGGKGEDDWVGLQIDWNEFSKLSMSELLTVPHQYNMYGDLFFKIVANKMKEMFKLDEKSKVLEIACGVGAVAQHLDCEYVGIDNCSAIIERHLELCSTHKLFCRDATDVGFDQREFDLVFIWNSLGFFKDISYIEKVLREAERVGKRYLFLGDVDINIWSKDYFLFNGWKEVELVGGSKRFLNFVKQIGK